MLAIRTDRLVLRPFRPDDATGLAARRSDPEIARHVLWDTPFTLEAAEALIARHPWTGFIKPGEGAQIAIEIAGGGDTVIGDCAVMMADDDGDGEPRQASIGYTLARAYHGYGYATEAARAIVDALFRGGVFARAPLHRITAICDVENVASQRVLERLGMRREAHLVENLSFKGAWGSEYCYAILRREWPD
jgi:aminoglycoside 6'-N-acetyltransferase